MYKVADKVADDAVRKTAHHGGLHPLLHKLLDSGPDGSRGVEQHLVEKARSAAADSPALLGSLPPSSSGTLTSGLSGHSSPPPPPPSP